MVYINLINNFKNPIFIHQLPAAFVRDNSVAFFENSKESILWDVVIVYEGIDEKIELNCKKGGLIFISGEPPDSRAYSKSFLNQFDHIISSHSELKHKNNHLIQQALPWHFGHNHLTRTYKYDFNQISNFSMPKKSKVMSFISSNKKMMPGHGLRFAFLEKIQKEFKNEIDIFGKGINPIDDKAEALLPYYFSICIENSSIDNYWTEKIADPFLAFCVPIYSGCTNIDSYFNSKSIIKIDVNDFNGSVKTIKSVLDNHLKIYEDMFEFLNGARQRVLYEYNIFPFFVKFYKEHVNNVSEKSQQISIYPKEFYQDYKIEVLKLKAFRFYKRIKLSVS